MLFGMQAAGLRVQGELFVQSCIIEPGCGSIPAGRGEVEFCSRLEICRQTLPPLVEARQVHLSRREPTTGTGLEPGPGREDIEPLAEGQCIGLARR